jgi:hypothetical protein
MAPGWQQYCFITNSLGSPLYCYNTYKHQQLKIREYIEMKFYLRQSQILLKFHLYTQVIYG